MKQYLNTTLRNITWFKQIHEFKLLDMMPEFQRHQVWSKKQQAYLIDTILRGYPIPEIYMQEIINEKGESNYLIIDGKQRISAVLEFIEERFPLNKDDSPEWANYKFSNLTPEEKKFFYEYNFVVRLLPQMTEEELRSIFQRLNRNVASLNKQELRQATYWGEFINLINNLTTSEQWDQIDIFSSNDIRRMLDAEFISELVVAMLHGMQNKKDNLDKYYRAYEEVFPDKDRIHDYFKEVLDIILSLIPGIRETRWNKKTDFYTLFLLIYGKLDEFRSANIPVIRDKLISFGLKVDEYQSVTETGENGISVDENVKLYSKNIRASSDLGSRQRRQQALESYLEL